MAHIVHIFDNRANDRRNLKLIQAAEFTEVRKNRRLYIGLKLSTEPSRQWLEWIGKLRCVMTVMPDGRPYRAKIAGWSEYPTAGKKFVIIYTDILPAECGVVAQSQGMQLIVRTPSGVTLALVNHYRFCHPDS